MQAIRISEIVGPTIQGEGALAGMLTVFVRTAGCDYRCSWCDTGYAVDPTFKSQWQYLQAAEIVQKVQALATGNLWVTLTGGNPAVWPLGELIEQLHQVGHLVAMETQGSIPQPWFRSLNELTVSPKPPSSGMKTDWPTLDQTISLGPSKRTSLKIVVGGREDYDFAQEVHKRYHYLPFWITPLTVPGRDTGVLADQIINWLVADKCYEFRVIPQIHVALWGLVRGK